ncbi:putative chitinase [Rosa chinensis]|uniref:chitinase n=1 Tax=Rosa chinensis TaxID=74649 RepID=A0A2P6RLG0_ROSCH|nr:putative chitinase [Rosa chinensis]
MIISLYIGQFVDDVLYIGGWPSAPDGPYAWGYCFIRGLNQAEYCTPSAQYPCASGKKDYGRGPIQLTYNYNYAQAGQAIGVDLINNLDLVATDPVVSFKTATWFWMTRDGKNLQRGGAQLDTRS